MSHPILAAIVAVPCLCVVAAIGLCMMHPDADAVGLVGLALVTGVGLVVAVPFIGVTLFIIALFGFILSGGTRPSDGGGPYCDGG